MKRAIYTAIVGGYDEIEQPPAIDKSFDYILFSNDYKESRVGVWEIRKIPYENKDKTRVARWVKTHPHLLLQEYQYSVWIDSNISIMENGAYHLFDELYEKGVLVSSFCHPLRDCIYDECLEVGLRNKDSFSVMNPYVRYLKNNHYLPHQGLCETNCVYRAHQCPEVVRFCTEWWIIIDTYSKRDQLSFNYLLQIYGVSFEYLLGKDHCARNHPFFRLTPHTSRKFRTLLWIKYVMCIANKVYPSIFANMIGAKCYSFSESFFDKLLVFMESILKVYVSFLYTTCILLHKFGLFKERSF